MAPKRQHIFDSADFAIIRAAKNSELACTKVKPNSITLCIDGMDVLIKKDDRGYLNLFCPCEFCGAKGVAKNIPCRRIIRALFWLTMKNGKVSELDLEPDYLKKKYPEAFKSKTL